MVNEVKMENTNMSELWKVEVDLLEKFKQICAKHNLSYCASFGTLIGAARHKGFIPWDDDIDLFMKWTDYKRFLEIAPAECQYPYFLQCYLTEKDGEVNASKLRRSDTTGFTRWELNNAEPEYNKGIFIDIFPLFPIPDTEEERSIQKESIMFFWKCIRGHMACRQIESGRLPNEEYVKYIPYYKSISKTMDIIEIKNAYLNACAMVEEPTELVGTTSYRVHKPSAMWKSDLFDSFVELPFENTLIRCPEDYDKVLSKTYGDWQTPSLDGASHEMVVIDTNTPWRDFDMTSINR